MNRDLWKSLEDIYGIVQGDLIKMDNMFKIPAYDYGTSGNRSGGNMQSIVCIFSRNNFRFQISVSKVKGRFSYFNDFGIFENARKQFADSFRAKRYFFAHNR